MKILISVILAFSCLVFVVAYMVLHGSRHIPVRPRPWFSDSVMVYNEDRNAYGWTSTNSFSDLSGYVIRIDVINNVIILYPESDAPFFSSLCVDAGDFRDASVPLRFYEYPGGPQITVMSDMYVIGRKGVGLEFGELSPLAASVISDEIHKISAAGPSSFETSCNSFVDLLEQHR